MKKALSLFLVLALCAILSLPVLGADAPAVRVSPQKLVADGREIGCEKDNSDGSNYFKLRDIAMLMRGTPAGFGISFDNDAKTVFAERGGEYEPLGTELAAGEDRSASCVPSVWTLYVDGEPVDVSTYNIGGSNFYKLRDMGSVLRFAVDYDPDSNTSFIFSDWAHTAVTDLKVPVGEAMGWSFSEPAEQHPRATIFYDGECELVGGEFTTGVPVVTRRAAEDGFVTYQVEIRETCALLIGGVDDPNRFADSFENTFAGYFFYDYYTGASFFNRILSGDDSAGEELLVSYRGKSYPCSYRNDVRYDDYGVWLEGENVSIEFTSAVVLTATVPADYDGLVLAIRCAEPTAEHEMPVRTGTASLSGVSYWEEDPDLGYWVFLRPADWAQDAD